MIAGEIYTLTQAARQMVAVGVGVEGHGGHVSGGGSYNRGSEVTLEATADDGYAFSHWILPGGGTDATSASLDVTVTSAAEYKAVFTPLVPQLAVASTSLRGVKLCWTNLAWATQYKVWRGTSSNRGQATEIVTLTNDGVCEYLDASGAENQSYWYWVEAVGVEDDAFSNGVQGRREKKTFSITYANLRGTTHANPATYREGTAVAFSAPSARRGYTFAGWSPSQLAADTSGDVTVRAIWIQNEYSVRFDLNGANGAMADERYTYGLWKYLTPTNFTRTGYVFAGWSAEGPYSSAAEYADAESLKNLTTELNGIVTLYAVWNALLGVENDPSAVVSGNASEGFVIKPSNGMSEVVVIMPAGFDPSKVTIEVAPEVQSLIAHGATIKVMKGVHDITAYLNIPSAGGTQFIASATVKQSVADEALDPKKGASFSVSGDNPTLTTSATKPGLTYTLREGATLKTMAKGAVKLGDGHPWTPTLTVKGGSSGFYTIKVEK